MSKPDWKDAPEWAKWLAKDADGEWFWWKTKPRASVSYKFWVPMRFPCTPIRAMRGGQNLDWTETLEPRP